MDQMEENKKSKWLWTPKQILFFVVGSIFIIAVGYPFILAWFFLTDKPAPESLSNAQYIFLGVGTLFVIGGLPLKNFAAALSDLAGRFLNKKS